MSCTDNLFKQFDSDQDQQKPIEALIMFLKEFFEKGNFLKNKTSADPNKSIECYQGHKKAKLAKHT